MNFVSKTNALKKLLICLLCVVIGASGVLVACSGNTGGEQSSSNVSDVPTTTDVAIDKENFVYGEGVVIEGVDVSDMRYNDALAAVEKALEKNIKDFELEVIAADKSYKYKKKDFKWNIGTEKAMQEAANASTAGKTVEVEVAVEVDTETVNTMVASIASDVDVKAVDATIGINGSNVNVSQDKTGRKLDQADLCMKIIAKANKMVKGTADKATINAVVNTVEPGVKLSELDGNIKLIATYSSWSTNTADANHNMKTALNACDGSVIKPGEVWSFNACTGNSNLTSMGYRPATVIVGGKFQQGVGGGLCQSSTAIYNAALLANMEIVERWNHYYQSSYAPAGLDATIDYPSLDLKLSNPTDYPMYMECYMSGTKLTVNIYGWDDPSFDEIKVTSNVHSGTKTGYLASAYRVYYLNGKEIDREELPLSDYYYPKEEETKPAKKPTKATKPTQAKPTNPVTTAPNTPKETDPIEPSAPTTVTTQPTTPIETTPVPTATMDY